MHMAANPALRAAGGFREIKLNKIRPLSPALADSVLMLPAMVTADECAHLAAAADRWCVDQVGKTVLPDYHQRPGLTRVECHVDGLNLDGKAHALAMIILSRALWNLEALRPNDALRIFNQRASLGDMMFAFSGHEPAINRYTAGGRFDAHEDKHMLTVLVPLSPNDAFEGGGTGFWSEELSRRGEPSLVLRPEPGTALFWTGQITHAGLPVLSGTRHVFVCSFDLYTCNL